MVIGALHKLTTRKEPRENKTLPKAFKERIMIAYVPPYSLKKTIWKGLRPALWVGGTALGLSLAGYFSDPQVLIALGVPSLVAVFAGESIRNALREYNKRK